ncbi:MAG: translation elongation factor Ts [Phycisphaeraceae bacterium]|nr:translation elongation factor Ts [Phycisphaeraceae bacterium]
MAISAKDVMTLRQRTGVGMMECKTALQEADGDMEAAIGLLREKLKGDMEERSDRQASEGVIAIGRNDRSVSMVELLSETDFAARNETFVETAQKIADLVLDGPDGQQEASDAISALVDDLRITIKENISLGRAVRMSGSALGSYLHHDRQSGALVVGEGEFSDALLTGLCQHVVAAVPPMVPAPLAVDESGIRAEVLAEQKSKLEAEARESGKPDSIIEKMIVGKIRKWVADNTLLGQTYIRELDAKKPVSHYLAKGATITSFVRFKIGD